MSGIWVSEHNRPHRIDSPVRFYDTTLRDGEQTVGVVFTPDEKVEIAGRLDRLGVSRIEAGFPRVSKEDASAFRRILELDLKAEVWGFSRAVIEDLDALIEMGVESTIIEIPTSEVKLEAYGFSHAQVVERAVRAIGHARDKGLTVLFFAVDGTRSELDFLSEVFQTAVETGAQEVAVVDTIGACGPEAAGFLVSKVVEWLGSDVQVHWHGHDDFGLATASAIAAVRAGAAWIQGTINGMGERAGNADIVEVATALQCLYGTPVSLDLAEARRASRTVAAAGGYQLDAWKPVVGENLFTRESGAVASQFHIPEAIEPFSSELVDAPRRIVLGKKSGLANIDLYAGRIGLEIPPDRRAEVLAEVKRRGVAKKGLIGEEEFREIVAAAGAAR